MKALLRFFRLPLMARMCHRVNADSDCLGCKIRRGTYRRGGEVMKRFSWHTEPGLAPHWYKIYGWLPNRYLPIVMFDDSIPFYKQNMKGGHRHNHVKNAHKRMRKCHVCGEPIVKGCEVIGYSFHDFKCRSCKTEEYNELTSLAAGVSFDNWPFEIRRRRK